MKHLQLDYYVYNTIKILLVYGNGKMEMFYVNKHCLFLKINNNNALKMHLYYILKVIRVVNNLKLVIILNIKATLIYIIIFLYFKNL